MNRDGLYLALSAILPHAGKNPQTDIVGLEFNGRQLYAYATDCYTSGVALIPEGPHVNIKLPTREANDLMRFVRPTVKATHIEEVAVGVRDGEFHVALADSGESAVFDTVTTDSADLLFLQGHYRALLGSTTEFRQWIYKPDYFARFAKAKHEEWDQVRVFPKTWDERHGAALVMVGDWFVGSIAAMSYDGVTDARIAEFLAA